MSTITFDTDAVIQRLRRAGLSEEQAREFVQALREAQTELVTKADLSHAVAMLERDLKIWTGKALATQAGIIIAVMALLKVFA